MKKITVVFVLLFSQFATAWSADLLPLEVRAKSVGLENSATCWMASVFAQGVFTGNPDQQQLLEFAQNLQGIYNSYGDFLVGQQEFNRVQQRKSPGWKVLSEQQQVDTWKQCTELWQAK